MRRLLRKLLGITPPGEVTVVLTGRVAGPPKMDATAEDWQAPQPDGRELSLIERVESAAAATDEARTHETLRELASEMRNGLGEALSREMRGMAGESSDVDELGQSMREALDLAEFLQAELHAVRHLIDDPDIDHAHRLARLRERIDAAILRVPEMLPAALIKDRDDTEERIVREREQVGKS